MTEIVLQQYKPGAPALLDFGTAGSYGIEQLRLVPEDLWQGLDITVTFAPPTGAGVTVQPGADMTVPVPAEATVSTPGRGLVTVVGYKAGVKIISQSIPYRLTRHGEVDADPPAEMTPSVTQQILAAVKTAQDIAQSVRDDADAGKFDGGPGPQGPPGTSYNIGSGLLLDTKTNTVSVDVADTAEKDNTRPITAAAVYAELGNIEVLLATI